MKKNYIVPMSRQIVLKSGSLLAQYSNAEAAVGATTLSRDGGNVFDDEE